MPPQEDSKKESAKALFLAGNGVSAIAREVGVSRPTIYRWADEDSWLAQREAGNVVQMRPAVAESERSSDRPSEPARRPELHILETAISDVSTAMGQASSEEIRSLGSLASALVKLLEYRRKVNPPTAAELAEQILELGVTPAELVKELKARWQRQA